MCWFAFLNPARAQESPQSNGLFVWIKDGNLDPVIVLGNAMLPYKEEWKGLLIEKAFTTRIEPLTRIVTVTGFDKSREKDLLKLISALSQVELAEPIPERHLFYTPNDLNSVQWGLKKIEAEKAWNFSKGGKGIVVALVDDGMDTAHVDLKGVLWHNTKEIPGNGKDDDGNGYKDDWFGWDVADNDNNPCVVVSDGLNHGTHCAGIIGAATDNGKGVASIGFNVKIMPLKCGKKGIPKAVFNSYKGVDYAINNGANVISMSWGGRISSYTEQALFVTARNKGILCVASAGNDTSNIQVYPAAYTYVMAVGSTTSTDTRSIFSNYGSWLTVSAPGSSIYSTFPGNAYGYLSGTSMACPLVSGLAALMWSRNPGAPVTQVESCIKSSCDNIDSLSPGFAGQLGAGRINAYKAMQCIKSINAVFSTNRTSLCPGDTVYFTDKSYTKPTSWKWTFNGGTPSTSTAQNPAVKYNSSGTYSVQLIVGNGTEYDTIFFSNYITVSTPSAKLTGNQTIMRGDYGTLKVTFTGSGPWDFTYTDGVKNYTIKNIQSNPYFILLKPDSSRKYKPVSVKQFNCTGSLYDSAYITVLTPQNYFCDSMMRFQYRFGGSGDDQAGRAVEYDDTSLIIAGKTSSYGAGGYDGFIARVSINGRLIWMKTAGGSSDDGFTHCTIDSKKNTYVGGFTNSGLSGRASTIAKYSSNGTLLWNRHFGASGEIVYKVLLSKDQKYIFAAGIGVTGGYGSEDYTLYKYDSSGNFQWARLIGDADLNRNFSIYEDDAGNVYTTGITGVPYPTYDGIIAKFSSSGSPIWKKKFKHSTVTYNDYIFQLVRWDSKTFIALGFLHDGSTNVYDYWVSKMDTSGSVKWSYKYKLNSSPPAELFIADKTIIVGGSNTNSSYDGYFLQLDSNGNVLKSAMVGTSATEFVLGMTSGRENSVLFAGYNATSGSNDVWFGRTNCKLNFGCNYSSAPPTVNSVSVNITNYSLSVKSFTSTVSPTFTKNSYTPTIKLICRSGKDSIPPLKCNPVADFAVDDACTGELVHFIDKSTENSGYTITNWFWDFNDGLKAAGQPNVDRYFYSKGTYKVSLIITSTDGKRICSDTVEKTYISHDSLHMKKMIADTTICKGDSVQFAAPSVICGVLPYAYHWSPALGVSDTSADRPFFSPWRTTRYYVTITDYNGNSIKDSVLISVNPKCCITYSRFEFKTGRQCNNDTIRLINKSTSKKNAKFTWQMPGANLTSYVGYVPPGLVYKTPGTYSITLMLKDSCGDDTFTSTFVIHGPPMAFAGNDTMLCLPDTIDLGGPAEDWYSYEWTPQTGLNNPYISSPTAAVSAPINYVLKVTSDADCIAYDTIKISQFKLVPDLGKDTTLCTGNAIFLRSNVKAPEYLWSNGSKIDSILIKKAGLYWLEVSTNNCKFRDSINIYFDTLPTFTLGKDTALCEDKAPLLLTPNNIKWPAALRLWDDASTGTTRNVSSSGMYWLEMKNNLCRYRDSISVIFDNKSTLSLGNDTTICESQNLTIIPKGNFGSGASYKWDNGAITPTRIVSQKGNYWVNVKEKTCAVSDTISVFTDSLPSFTLGKDTAICEKQFPVSLTVKNMRVPGATKLWENGSNTLPRIVNAGGAYWLTMQNGKCTFKDTIILTKSKNPAFTLGNDTVFCTVGGNLVLQPQGTLGSGATYLWDNASTGSQRSVNASGLYWVKVTENNCDAKDSIKIQMDTIPQFTLGSDTAICPQHFPFTLSPKGQLAKNPAYVWENGSVVPGRSIAAIGNYKLTATHSNCVFTDSIRIDSLQRPYVKLPADTNICLGDTLALQAPLIANTSYSWNTGEKTYNKTVLFAGGYEVTLKNKCGQAKDDIKITTKDCSCPIYIPNSFTPSHSPNINDDFHVVFDCPYEKFEIMIYNRWGELVFRSTDTAFRWNGVYAGRVVPNGAYMVVMKLKQKYENNGKEFLRSGYLYVAE